jgi:hypothetical protein
MDHYLIGVIFNNSHKNIEEILERINIQLVGKAPIPNAGVDIFTYAYNLPVTNVKKIVLYGQP